MDKLDLRKTDWKNAYTAKPEPKTITVPPIPYLVMHGEGNPNTSPAFTAAIETLYPLAYTLKFMIKKGQTELEPVDYGVMPLEGQWYAEDMNDFHLRNKDSWQWDLMIAQPPFVTQALVEEAKASVRDKKKIETVDLVEFRTIEDGLSAQLLHVGPYDEETANIQKLHDYIATTGHQLSGQHREIYLSDARRTAPDKLKTIIRQPMRKA